VSNSVFNASTNTWWVNGTMRFTNIHPLSKCEGRNCIVHNPSDTVANREDWPYLFRDAHAGGRVERLCKHWVGHPDKDQVTFLEEVTGEGHWGIHGCDFCCVEGCDEA
jgi:hypothetical protein